MNVEELEMVSLNSTAPLSKANTLQLDATQDGNPGSMRQPLSSLTSPPWNKPLPSHAGPNMMPLSIAMPETSLGFTPPSTPPSHKREDNRAPTSADLAILGDMNHEMSHVPETLLDKEFANTSLKPREDSQAKEPIWNEISPRVYSKRYEILGSASSGLQEFGRGVWSVVYRAKEASETTRSTLLTPPTSPAQPSVGEVLAVKAPCRQDAYGVLEKEARVLTYLHSFSHTEKYLVPFHGFNPVEHSIVLSAIPLSLDKYAKAGAENARLKFSTKTMCDPVIGVEHWMQLASHLIDGLVFLHSKNCVHGDIKPANILLCGSESEFLTPLFCDFSSAKINTPLSSNALSEREDEIEGVSAVTPDYTSPELLDAIHRHTNTTRAIATPTSDVFALAVTLMVAATGESPYASARMEVQKLSMAKEGRPLDFARGGENSSRVMKGRLVDKVLKCAIEREAEKRWSAEEWRLALDAILEERKVAKAEKETRR